MTLWELLQKRLAGKYPTAMDDYLEFLHQLVIDTEAQQVIELGVHTGASTTALLAALTKTGGALWSCDPGPPRVPIKDHLDNPAWTFVPGQAEEVIQFAPETCDILLCDASKAEAGLLWQLRNYGDRVRPGGWILVHDAKTDWIRDVINKYLEDRTGFLTLHEKGKGMAAIFMVES